MRGGRRGAAADPRFSPAVGGGGPPSVMLYLVGLGLGDAKDITVKGLEAVRRCRRVYLEAYTSVLTVGKEALVGLVGRRCRAGPERLWPSSEEGAGTRGSVAAWGESEGACSREEDECDLHILYLREK